ncbi:MAG: hypothetical protein KF803_09200 [Cyclobacteriaceae bacterium]|nr:hypothetical protein [Cyclobacteriaceae bacterium]
MFVKQLIGLSGILIMIACGCQQSFAQGKPARYAGPYTLGNSLTGNVDYHYVLSQRDTVKHGPFLFNSVARDSINTGSINSVTLKGSYSNGLKIGEWVFSSKKIQPLGKLRERDYQIVYQSKGSEFVAQGFFKEGKPHGKWLLVEQHIEDSSPTDTLLVVNAEFKDGIMRGDVNGIFNQVVFSGSINDEGFVDGRWLFRYPKLDNKKREEYRFFEDGVQVKHFLLNGSDTIVLEHRGVDKVFTTKEDWETLAVNGRYFEVFGFIDHAPDQLTAERIDQTNALIQNVLSQFYEKSGMKFWSLSGGSDTFKNVLVRLKRVHFTDEERRRIGDIVTLTREATDMFEYFFEESGIEVDRLANEELMLYYQVLKIYKQQVDRISKLVNQFSSPAFEYMNRNELLKSLCDQLVYPRQIGFDFKGEHKVVEYNFPAIAQHSYPIAESIILHLNDILSDVERIENEVDRILESKLRQARLNDKEKNLIRKKDSLISLYNNTFEDEAFNEFHQQVASRILNQVSDSFERYANLELQQKIDTIDYFNSCFESFLQLYKVQTEIPAKLKRLDEAYTRTVWNPYTMTDMQERMKERVYNAYELNILPFYLKDMESSVDCDDVAAKLLNFEMIYRRMMELREQDTKDIERSLRGLNSTTRILQVLNINLHSN